MLEKYKARTGGRKKNPFSVAAAATEIKSELEKCVKVILANDEKLTLAVRET